MGLFIIIILVAKLRCIFFVHATCNMQLAPCAHDTS